MSAFEFTVFKGGKNGINQATTKKDALKGDQVYVKVTHSGLCGTDEHFKDDDMVLGHEGVGVVQELGPDTKHLKVGDRVGWGYVHDACGSCELCLTGKENYCEHRHFYGKWDLDQGSMATHAVWREAFLFKIPDAISNRDAAPLMCGGATVFEAMTYGVDQIHRVGVIGIGGLGHLAIQFAAKMGCEVVVFSSTDSKKEEAMSLGAKEFYAIRGLSELNIKPVHHLFVTTSFLPDWKLFGPIMAANGTIYPLTVSSDNIVIPNEPIVEKGLRIQGSVVAPRHSHRKMLEFAAFHGIRPMINEYPLTKSGVIEAMKVLRDGKMRYRGVLVAQN